MKYIKTFEEIQEEEVQIEYHDIDDILNAYFECALWTEEDNEEINDKDLNINDISPESEEQAREQIEWFVETAGDALNDIEDDSIGHDLWLNRNGHGAGFWDRGYDEDVAELLTFLCENLGEAYIEVDDNDKIRIYSYSDKYKTVDINKYKENREFQKNVKKYNI